MTDILSQLLLSILDLLVLPQCFLALLFELHPARQCLQTHQFHILLLLFFVFLDTDVDVLGLLVPQVEAHLAVILILHLQVP